MVGSRWQHTLVSAVATLALLGFPAFVPLPLFAASLPEIVARGKLIVGVKDNLRPLGFRDEAGNLQGLEIEIARKLAQDLLGNPEAVELRPLSNLERLPALDRGEVDLVIANLSRTASRDRLVNFSRYYYLNSTAFVTLDPNRQHIGDLASKKIALLQGSSTIAVVRHELPGATLIPVRSYQEARSLLEGGKADAFAADLPILVGWVQEYPRYRLLGGSQRDRIPGESLCIATPKGLAYSSLYLRINQLLSDWQISGWLNERIARWELN